MSICRFVLFAGSFLVFAGSGGPLLSGLQSPPKAEIVGISVTRPAPESEFGGSMVPGRSPGVEVHLRIEDPKAFFISAGSEDQAGEGKPAIFDSTGKEFPAGMSFGFNTSISEDGHAVTFPVSTPELPSSGASGLHVRGTVVLIAGRDSVTEETALTLTPGTEIRLGGVAAKLSTVEDNSFGEEGLMLGFESSKPFDAIQELVFLDEKGTVLESGSAGSGSFGFNDQMTYSRNYALVAKPEKVTLRVRYFKATEAVKIPVDLPVTLSLGK